MFFSFGNIKKGVGIYKLNCNLGHNEAERLKELDEIKNKLYTNITHEFRTPLTVIMGMADQIKGNEKAKAMIHRNSKNLLTLVNQMLDLSKLDSGKANLRYKKGDIILYLQYLTESFDSLASGKNVRLTFYCEENEFIMDYDEEKIKSIIHNLLSNAIKFTQEGGTIVLHVKIKNENLLQIKCKDSGIGIAEADLPYIFDRFYQVDGTTTRSNEGTGIGLALIKELVKVLNGSISVKSDLGKGTEFTVLLPVPKELESAVTQSEVLPQPDVVEASVPLIKRRRN